MGVEKDIVDVNVNKSQQSQLYVVHISITFKLYVLDILSNKKFVNVETRIMKRLQTRT